jgi:competence protein ComEC
MNKKTIIFLIAFLFCLNVFAWQEAFVLAQPKYLQVNFLNVGQGDSAFIETPQGHQIIIDGGPGSTLSQKLPYLMPFWDKTIDLVILSHPEKDHMQGLINILQNYKADYILWSGIKKETSEHKAWLNVLEKQKAMGSKILIAQAGQEIKAGQVLIDTLFPLKSVEGQEIKNSSNSTGVVNKVIFGNLSFLFTGDISSTEEKALVYSGEDITSNFLKIAHHGSKYSSSSLFLQKVSPNIAIIDVGKNSYGHPTSEVLNRLENFGIKVLRTDTEGDIKFVSDGKVIKKF